MNNFNNELKEFYNFGKPFFKANMRLIIVNF